MKKKVFESCPKYLGALTQRSLFHKHHGRTDRRTDRPTDGPTDGPTDQPTTIVLELLREAQKYDPFVDTICIQAVATPISIWSCLWVEDSA